MKPKLLEVQGLVTQFTTEQGVFNVVDDVSFSVEHGETVGLVGESGSGKSITALSILGLVKPPGMVAKGSMQLEGEELTGKPKNQLRKIRGRDISVIFQEPMTSLNPVLTVGEQITETIRLHQGMNRKEAMERAINLLHSVSIPMPETRVNQFPHQLSGGMRQRVMIAMALSCNPKLLIADEPTTALDVTIQAQILDLMKKLKEELDMGILLITHDLGVVAEMCKRTMVMYAGQVVEQGPVAELFKRPIHPYTEGLLNSIPKLHGKKERLYSIAGNVPSPMQVPKGCRFHTRCPHAFDRCRQEEPPLRSVDADRAVSCWLYEGV